MTLPPGPPPTIMVSPIYLVPTDREPRRDAPDAILQGVLAARAFYARALARPSGDTATFAVDPAGVRLVRGTRPAAELSRPRSDTTPADVFAANVRDEAVALTPDLADARHTRLVFVDAEPPCGVIETATYVNPRLSVFDGKRIRGLAGDDPPNHCPGAGAPWSSSCFYAGTVAHETAHAFGVPHPAACEKPTCAAARGDAGCPRPPMCFEALMYLGRDLRDPKVAFLDEDKERLRASPFLLPIRADDVGPVRCARKPPRAR